VARAKAHHYVPQSYLRRLGNRRSVAELSVNRQRSKLTCRPPTGIRHPW
jgi:hypothetical protein